MINKKTFTYEAIFFLSLISLLIYLISYYISLSVNADKDMVTINKMRYDKNMNEAPSLLGGIIHKTTGDAILNRENGHSITLSKVMYQSCLRFGMSSVSYDYFAVNGKIVKTENHEPFREVIFNECYKQPYNNTVTFYYSE